MKDPRGFQESFRGFQRGFKAFEGNLGYVVVSGNSRGFQWAFKRVSEEYDRGIFREVSGGSTGVYGSFREDSEGFSGVNGDLKRTSSDFQESFTGASKHFNAF